ncbi:MFS transporter [Streptomyces glaucosporus]|uniref:Multidrug efflux pump Tap n=1 Tax=Streptomyces glaucosporus TaxID=284044 RepID=A0ABN3HKY2_9ACTN
MAAETSRGTRVRSARRPGGLALLLTAALCSGAGNAVTAVAMPWLVLEETGRASSAGLVAAAGSLPLLAGIAFGGIVVDRMGRRPSSIVSDALSAGSVLLVAVLHLQQRLPLPLLVALVVAGAALDQSGITAKLALVNRCAREGGVPAQRANALYSAAVGLAVTCGPGLAGLLLGTAGVGWTLCAATVLSGLAAVVMSFLRSADAGREGEEPAPGSTAGPAGGLRYAVEGFVVVGRDPLLRLLVLLTFGFSVGSLPTQNIALPRYFQVRGEPEVLGLLLLCMSAGGILGSLAYGALGDRLSRRRAFAGAVVASTVLLLALATLPSTVPLLLLGTAIGLVAGPITPVANTAIQNRVPSEALGRVLSVLTAATCAAGPVGYLLGGPLIDRLGAGPAMAVFASTLVPVSVAALVAPSLRGLDTPDPPAGPHRAPRPGERTGRGRTAPDETRRHPTAPDDTDDTARRGSR